jgi:hypothetical protein
VAIILDGDIGVTAADVAATTLSINAGYGSNAAAYGCRAWVNFNGTGTVAIKDSGNVSSVTDNGTGDYTINFTTALPDVNYCVSAFGVGYASNNVAAGTNIGYYPSGSANYTPLTKTTTTSRILVGYGGSANLSDVADLSFTVIR